MIVFILPFFIFLYESDPDRSIIGRICGALIYEFVIHISLFTFYLFFQIIDCYCSIKLYSIYQLFSMEICYYSNLYNKQRLNII